MLREQEKNNNSWFALDTYIWLSSDSTFLWAASTASFWFPELPSLETCDLINSYCNSIWIMWSALFHLCNTCEQQGRMKKKKNEFGLGGLWNFYNFSFMRIAHDVGKKKANAVTSKSWRFCWSVLIRQIYFNVIRCVDIPKNWTGLIQDFLNVRSQRDIASSSIVENGALGRNAFGRIWTKCFLEYPILFSVDAKCNSKWAPDCVYIFKLNITLRLVFLLPS